MGQARRNFFDVDFGEEVGTEKRSFSHQDCFHQNFVVDLHSSDSNDRKKEGRNECVGTGSLEIQGK